MGVCSEVGSKSKSHAATCRNEGGKGRRELSSTHKWMETPRTRLNTHILLLIDLNIAISLFPSEFRISLNLWRLPLLLSHLFACYHPIHPDDLSTRRQVRGRQCNCLALSPKAQSHTRSAQSLWACQVTKMRADDHGELSKTCSGFPLHLAAAPKEELEEGIAFTVL